MPSQIEVIGNDTKFGKILNKNFVSLFRHGFVEVGIDKYCLPIYYQDYEEEINNFQVRDDDIFVATHPKAGTTLATEMVWLIKNDLDYTGAKKFIQDRCPLFELPICYNNLYPGFIENLENLKSPRIMRTHLPWPLMPELITSGNTAAKVVYVKRNPLDTCVSYYHHCRLLEEHQGDFNTFCKTFLAGKTPFGSFWKVVSSYWEQRHRPNVMILDYEDMVNDIFSVLERVSIFLGKKYTYNQIKGLAEHLSFDSMKKNSAVNFENIKDELKGYGLKGSKECFIRRGKVGGYKSEMSENIIAEFKSRMKESVCAVA